MTEVAPEVKFKPLEEIKEEEEPRYGQDSLVPTGKNNEEKPESPPLAPEQKKILVAMLLSIGMTQTLYMNISTLLPTEGKKLFPPPNNIADAMIAFIIA